MIEEFDSELYMSCTMISKLAFGVALFYTTICAAPFWSDSEVKKGEDNCAILLLSTVLKLFLNSSFIALAISIFPTFSPSGLILGLSLLE